jgi:ribosomal protein L29
MAQALRERCGIRPIEELSKEELERWVRELQDERTRLRALAQQKRKEPKPPRVPKPRKHKKHCEHEVESKVLCCKCEMFKCLKPKRKKKPSIQSKS